MMLSALLASFRTRLTLERGQTMAEYGIVLAVLTIGAVAAFTALSGGVEGAIKTVTSLLP